MQNMSILDKRFLKDITNHVPEMTEFREYYAYLESPDIERVLNATVLCHDVEYDTNEDLACLVMFLYEEKYIVLHIFMATSSECGYNGHESYRNIVLDALDKAYVTTNREEAIQYYKKQLLDVRPNWSPI